MTQVLDEFKIVFGMDDKPLNAGIQKTESTLKGLGKVFGAVFAGFVSYGAIKSIIEDFANLNVKLSDSTELLGVTAGDAQALGNALERFGGNTDAAIRSLESLTNNLEQAKTGQGALLEVSRKYGLQLDPFASANDTLQSLSGQMGKYTAQQRKAIANQLGLDESLARAFADGGEELNKLIAKQKELGTTTEEDIAISKDFANAQLDLKDMFGALIRDMARVVLPAFTKLVEIFSSFIGWARRHKQVVIGFFVGLAIALTPVLIGFAKIAIASIAAFAPLYAVVAIATAIAVVVEDVYYYFMGWDSATGDLVKQFPAIGTALEFIRPIVVGIFDVFEGIVNFLKDPSWGNFIAIFETIGNAALEFVQKPIDAVIETIMSMFDMVGNLGNKITEAFKDLDVFGWFGDDEKNKAELQKAIPNAPAVPNVSNANTVNNMNVNNNFNQNITTATPKQFADDTNSQIVNSINGTRQQVGAL